MSLITKEKPAVPEFKSVLIKLQYYIFSKKNQFITDAFMSIRGDGKVDLSAYYSQNIEIQMLYLMLLDIKRLPSFDELDFYHLQQDIKQYRNKLNSPCLQKIEENEDVNENIWNLDVPEY